MLRLLRRVRAAVHRGRLDAELRAEMAQHVEWKAQSYTALGIGEDEARRRAAVDVGNVTRLREDARAMWGFPTIDSIHQDLVYGARLLRRSPGFAAVAVLSLAVGIGSSAAVFSLTETVFLRSMPVADPSSLFVVKWRSGPVFPFSSLDGYGEDNEQGLASTSFSYAAYQAFQMEGAPYVDVLGFADLYNVNTVVDGRAELATAHAVSGNYFDVLGVRPSAGRPLGTFDDKAEAPPAAILSYAAAHHRFGDAAAAVGQTVAVNSVPFTIVGVMPRAFHGTGQVGTDPDLYIPMAMKMRVVPGDDPPQDPNFWWVLMLARLKPGVEADRARDALDVMLKSTVAAAKPALAAKDLPKLTLVPGGQGQVENRETMRDPLRMMAAVTAIVLLVACANVAGLLLARGRARVRELSVRAAIGAARRRIVRQLITESVLLAAAAAALGVGVAWWLGAALAPALADSFADTPWVGALDWRVLLFAIAIAVGCAVAFGFVPAIRATQVDVSTTLQEGGRGTVGHRRLLPGTLIVVQIALSLLLIAGAGLLVRSLRNLQLTELGFDPSHLLLFRVDPSLSGYEGQRTTDLYGRILENVRRTPGVIGASLSSHRLISHSSAISIAARPDEHSPAPDSPEARAFDRSHLAWSLIVDERFFQTLSISVLRGRTFEVRDEGGGPVAVINQALAKQLFGSDDVLGREIVLGSERLRNRPPVHVIGIVADAKYTGIRDPKPPTFYLYYRQQPDMKSPTFEVRTAGPPSALASTMRQIVHDIDANVPMFAVMSQTDQIDKSLMRERLFARLATLLGSVAIMLSTIGLYGLLAYGVARRTPEIGLRMALGAAQRSVRWMVLRESILLVAVGIAAGVPAALAGTTILESLLFGLDARDPITIAAAAVVMIALALFAAYLPARRAARVDPMIALRAE